MTRIVPETSQRSSERLPKWLNPAAIIDAAKNTLQKITKTANVAGNTVVTEYANARTGKRYFASHPDIKKQASETKVDPVSGEELSVYRTQQVGTNQASPRFAALEVRSADIQRGDVNKETGSGTYNTFVDRHVVYKVTSALQRFAVQNGMTAPTVTYIRSEHSKMAGQEYPSLNNALCKIEWMYAPRQKVRAFASIGLDEAGNYVFPRVFTTVNGTDIPFEKRSVREFESNFAVHTRNPIQRQKKSDVPTYRRPDITRFRAVSASSQAPGMTSDEYVALQRPGMEEDMMREKLQAKYEQELQAQGLDDESIGTEAANLVFALPPDRLRAEYQAAFGDEGMDAPAAVPGTDEIGSSSSSSAIQPEDVPGPMSSNDLVASLITEEGRRK